MLRLTLLLMMLAAPLGAVEVGDVAPEVTFAKTWNMPEGQRRLSDFRGKVVMLEVWATW